MEGVLSIVLVVAAIASLVFAVVMAIRSGRGGEVDEEKMERRFEIVCGVIVLGVIGAVAWWLELGGIVLVLLAVLLLKGGTRAGVNEDVVVVDRVGDGGVVDCAGLSENNN